MDISNGFKQKSLISSINSKCFDVCRRLIQAGLLLVIAGTAQSVQAACSVAKFTIEVDKVNSIWNNYGETIYFCKQDFSSDQLTYYAVKV